MKRMADFSNTIKTCLCALALVGINASAGECDNWQTAQPNWLWCDDFEASTTLAQRYEDVSTKGMAVTSASGLSASKSLEQVYTPGQVDAGWIIKYKSEGFPDHVFYRFYHKFGAGYTTAYPQKMSRIGYRSHSTWTEIFRVHTWFGKTTGILTLDVMAKNSTQANSGGYLPVASSGFSFAEHLDEWVAVEVELKLNTPGSKDGLYRLWLNDSLVVERLNVDMRGTTADKINEVMLDTYWNGGSTGNLKRFYDNFVISTQKIGRYNTAATISPPSAPKNVLVD